MLTGRTFSNPEERGDYPSEQWASLTDDELARIFTIFVVDIYHNTPHAGLNGETPANAWKRLAAERAVTAPPDPTCRRVVFGIPLARKLGRHGVRVLGIDYTSTSLQQAFLRGRSREVDIRVDPHNLAMISARLEQDWDNAWAVPTAVHGLSLNEWQAIVRDLRIQYRNEAVLTDQIVQHGRSQIREIDQTARKLKPIQPIMSSPAAEVER
ncbi:hypothetical protein EHS39_32535 [Ensifer sp. MPMI2T]|nr:hypothetical protein EHS39_32535 [Ensifer sp. MPMI2T]